MVLWLNDRTSVRGGRECSQGADAVYEANPYESVVENPYRRDRPGISKRQASACEPSEDFRRAAGLLETKGMSVPSAASSVSKPTAHKRTCFRSETSSFLGQIQVLQVAELSETINMSFSSRVAACRYTTELQGKSATMWAEAKADKTHWQRLKHSSASRSLLSYVTPSHWIELLGSQGQAG